MIARIAIVSAALTVIGGAVAPRAKAADAPAAFGSVDVNKLQSGYNKLSDIKSRVKQIGDDFSARLKTQANYDMLSLDEQRQLGALLGRTPASDQEKATIGSLENKSSHDSQELATLQQKPAAQLTDSDKARLTALTTEHQNGQQALQQISDEYQNDFNAQQEKISSDLTDQLRAAIAQVAKERGLAVVFDSSVAIYSANDITDDVLKRLNK
jgi:Skp family chaperone for outer membrane proteins